MQINPITNSQQRTSQKQQSFGAFTYTQPLHEIEPILKRAKNVDIRIFTPKEVLEHLRDTKKINGTQEEILTAQINNHLFTEDENSNMINKAIFAGGFDDVSEYAQRIIAKAIAFPLEVIQNSIKIKEKAIYGARKNERIFASAKARMEIATSNIESYRAELGDQNEILRSYGI